MYNGIFFVTMLDGAIMLDIDVWWYFVGRNLSMV
jgi:hypothetical protein